MGNAQPPKWALKFLRWYCREEYLEEIEGDLFEFYYLRLHTSKNSADLFFIWNVMRSFRLINFKKTGLLNNWTMNLFKNYTKIYFRRFRRETSHFLVNIIGLGMGFSILFYILMYVHDEQSIDGFHSKKDRIYRIVDEQKEEDGIHQYVSTPGPLAEALKNEYPSIEEAAHLTYSGSQLLAVGEIRLDDRQWAMASKEIFDILDIEIIAGNPRKEFPGMAGMVVTEDLALRLFGSVDVVGEMVEETNFGPTEVLAVMKQMPKNSSYKFHNIYVTNYEQFPAGWKNFIGSWRGRFTETWVLTNENTDLRNHEVSQDFLSKYLSDDAVENTKYRFQNILDIHLGSEGIERGGMSPRLEIPYSNPSFLSMILWMGLLVLFIAALNYINLSSVQALRRTLEASMRKINGAGNKHLLIQLFFETLLTVMIAYTVAMVLVIIFFPFFLDVAKKELELSLLFSVDFIAYHLGAILIIWFASALLPAIYYSQLKRQLLVLKNAFSGKGDLLRKVLVGVQYALAIFLIIGSLVIYRQLNYVQSKDLGFELDKLITLDINSGAARREFKNIVNGLLENPNVVNASTSSRVPGEWKNIPIAMVGVTQTDALLEFSHYASDHRWLDTYGLELAEGRNFSGSDSQDSLNIIINVKATEILGLEEPVGTSLWVGGSSDTVRMTIIGVMEDFHFKSMYEPIGPVILTSWNNHIRSIDYFTIRYSGNVKETIDHIEMVNTTFDPNTPAELNFLDEQWDRFYQAEESRATLMLIASVLSIIISAFGLFGLINFTVERKTKEIGVRKVLGASVANIVRLVLKDYLVLLTLSLAIAAPFSWWLFSDWLADFAYRIGIGIDLFLIAFVVVLTISFTTVLGRIFRIAKSSPVTSMRYE